MIKFIRHLWKQYRKEQKIHKAQEDLDNMIVDMKTMTSKQMEDKWKNPTAVFARLQWEIHKAKNDILQCKKCRKHYKEGFSCKCED